MRVPLKIEKRKLAAVSLIERGKITIALLEHGTWAELTERVPFVGGRDVEFNPTRRDCRRAVIGVFLDGACRWWIDPLEHCGLLAKVG